METEIPVILVTGASSGIGEATALRFARQGYGVILAARRIDRLEALSERIANQGGIALPVAADLSELAQIQRLVEIGMAEFGHIDVLVNNAGFGRLNWLEKLDPVEDIESQFRVNLIGLVQTTRAVLPHMIERKRGHIINIASMSGYVGTPTYSIYSASKHGVRGFSEALRREVGIWGIHVSVIYPGGVVTEFAQHIGYQRRTGITTPGWLQLSAEDVARAVWDEVRHPRRTVIIPPIMGVVTWINFFFPGVVDRLIEWRFTRPERAG
jgi:short-subunit dehydrogenase